MIKVTYERYHNDYTRMENQEATFGTICELVDWVRRQANPRDGIYGFNYLKTKDPEDIHRIEFSQRGEFYDTTWIHKIENENGIIFSDGRYTSRQVHCGSTGEEILRRIKAIRDEQYNFVD